MDVFMHAIPITTSEEQIHDHFKVILHKLPYTFYWAPGYLMSFSIRLHNARRDSKFKTGTLSIPNKTIAWLLIENAQELPPFKICLKASNTPIDPDEAVRLRDTPYQDPTLLRERIEREKALVSGVSINGFQFGWLDRGGCFSCEWKRTYGQGVAFDQSASVKFSLTLREIRIEEHPSLHEPLEPSNGYTPRHVMIRFDTVVNIGYYDRHRAGHVMIFALRSNPAFEELPPARSMGQKRLRRQSMHCELHKQIVAFTSRTVLLTFGHLDDLRNALDKADIARLPKHSLIHQTPHPRNHFTPTMIQDIESFASHLSWPIASKVLSLMQRLVVSAKELVLLRLSIIKLALSQPYNPRRTESMIEAFGQAVQLLKVKSGEGFDGRVGVAIQECFKDATLNVGFYTQIPQNLPDDIILAYHLNITPTSRQIHGPYPEQSNRVLRQFRKHQDHFLRVVFTDEDRLEHRFSREVDGKEEIEARVGGILKNPLFVAGRRYEFLAYSNSALKEHSVYFVAPFTDEALGVMTAERIREGLGNFNSVINCPARYGARMSQAFTSTNVSITVDTDDIQIVEDIEENGVIFTDGVGTCSRQTMDSIAESLRFNGSQKRNRQRRGKFGAVQIRLGGSKGILSVDYLNNEPGTIYIRRSMWKFASQSHDVEIADTFECPKRMFLNRPLIMILETLGTPLASFLKLQQKEINFVETAVESFKSSAQLLEGHGLGTAFRIPSVFLSLSDFGLTVDARPSASDFFGDGMNLAVNHVLHDLKHRARIPVEGSYTLVGVADIHRFLREGEIFVCLIHADRRKEYIEGPVIVTRSPAIHPGNVQIAYAIGSPPEGSPFSYEDLPNCVVFACQGQHSLPQSLGGGDLDGDLYNIILLHDLFPERTVQPATYTPARLRRISRPCVIDDVADFVVDYFNNDYLGLIAVQNLLIADGSSLMSEDPQCIKLARLHSCAVDFQKSGVPADITSMPQAPRVRPDWSRGELGGKPNVDFYESQRALGVLFRNVILHSARKRKHSPAAITPWVPTWPNLVRYEEDRSLRDVLSCAIIQRLEEYPIFLNLNTKLAEETIIPLFKQYSHELSYICANFTLTSQPLTEEECWVGTISVRSSQHRVRSDLQARLREQTTLLVDRVREELKSDNLEEWLTLTWVAWRISRQQGDVTFGAKTYGFVALGSMFEALKAIDRRRDAEDSEDDYD